jgi:imidazoleglycerol-phosphate dehydratase
MNGARTARIARKTTETDITVSFNLDGQGVCALNAGVPFLEHMLTLWSKHGRFDLEVTASGDTAVDDHHTVEDIGICLGTACRQALGDKSGSGVNGSALIPMDDALAMVAVDLSGRPYLAYDAGIHATAGSVNLKPAWWSKFYGRWSTRRG